MLTKEPKQKSFLRDISSVFSSNFITLVIAFVTSILLARYLGPDGRGIFTAILIYPILLTSLAELGIRQATVYLIGNKDYESSEIIGVLLWFLVVSSTVSILIVAGIFSFLKEPDFTLAMMLLALFYIPFKLTISYTQGVFLGRREIRRFSQLTWIPPVTVLIGIILLVVILQLNVVGALIATLAGNALLAYYALRLLSENTSLTIRFNFEMIKKLLGLGILYAIALFILQLNYKVDIIIMQQLSTAAEIGQYAVAVSVADLLWQIPSAVGIVIFSHSANAKDPALFSKSMLKLFRVTFLLAIICGIPLFFLAPYIMPLIYGPAFSPSATAVQLILPGIVLMVAFKVLNMDLAGKGKPVISLISFIPAVILNIILNILWDPVYGANGAAFASTVSYSLGALLFVYVYSKELKISMSEMFRYRWSDFDFIVNFLKKRILNR